MPPILDPNAPPDEDDDVIEVEVAMPGEQLPQASSAAATALEDGDDGPYEVEVVVDFGVAVVDYPTLTASNMMTHAQQQQPVHVQVQVPPPATAGAEAGVKQDQGNNDSDKMNPVGVKKSKRRSTLGLTLKGGDVDESDRMSDVSESWAEDRYAPVTTEEKQVNFIFSQM